VECGPVLLLYTIATYNIRTMDSSPVRLRRRNSSGLRSYSDGCAAGDGLRVLGIGMDVVANEALLAATATAGRCTAAAAPAEAAFATTT